MPFGYSFYVESICLNMGVSDIARARKRIISCNMRYYRENFGASQIQISEILGVSPQFYNGCENGKYTPNIEILIRLSYLYGISMDAITSKHCAIFSELGMVNAH